MGTSSSHTQSRGVHSHPAFTLTEFGVLALIAALAIALAAPSLANARRQTRLSLCAKRLKDIGVASRAYMADDPNGWYIPVHPLQYNQCPGQTPGTICNEPMFIGAYEWGGKSGIGRDRFLTGSPGDPLNSKYGAKFGLGAATRPLNSLLYPTGFQNARSGRRLNRTFAKKDTELELDTYRCPADNGPPGGAHCPDWIDNPTRSSFDHFGNSYAANVFMVTSSGSLGPGFKNGEMGSNSPYLRPGSRIPTPARTIAYEENIGRWAWASRRELDAAHDAFGGQGCPWIGQGVDPGPSKTLRGWHGRNWTYNHAFIDTHVELQPVYIDGTEDEDGYAMHYVNERVGSPSNVCIIIRGEGWQKDTLPSPFMRTLLRHSGSGRGSYEDCVWSNANTATRTEDRPDDLR